MASNNARRYTLEDVVCEEAKEKLKLYYEPWNRELMIRINPDVKRFERSNSIHRIKYNNEQGK